MDHSSPAAPRFETRVPGAQYQAGWLRRFLLGSHYRDLWTTPIQAPVLDLDTYAGGLTLEKRGGGVQTKTLRFRAGHAQQFIFRSVDKNPEALLSQELRNSIVSRVLQDQISTGHPYSAPVVSCLAEAVGLLHPSPVLVIMPDDDRLGPHREEFAGMLGYIEERPNEGLSGRPGFADSEKIVSTRRLFEKLDEDHDNQLQAVAYLRARLLDILVGDWDRGADQWRWARFDVSGRNGWYPIPRDRDNAFAKFDGLLPSIADWRFVIRQIEGFNKEEPDIVSLTYSGRYLDRRFLNGLSYDMFAREAEWFVEQVSDSVIDYAVRQLPQPAYEKAGAELATSLKQRRDYLPEAAEIFYRELAKFVDIKASHQSEQAEVIRFDDNHVQVRIFERVSDDSTGRLLYQRVFKRGETNEIRLYLLGGDDKAVVSGRVDQSIKVRIIGGDGQDTIIDTSKVSGDPLGRLPVIKDGRKKTYVYDHEATTELIDGPSTIVKLKGEDSNVNAYGSPLRYRDYGHIVQPIPFLEINADDGLFLGAGLSIYHYGFRKRPYSSYMSLSANYAFRTGNTRIRYLADYIDVADRIRLSLFANAWITQEVQNYYGLGNESERIAELESRDFYRVRSKEYLLSPAFRYRISPRIEIPLGIALKHFDTILNDSTLVRSEQPYGLEVTTLIKLKTGLEFDTRDRPVATQRGVYLDGSFSYLPSVFDHDSAFTKAKIEGRYFFSPHSRLTLAFRTAAKKIWGGFPFHEAATIGGQSSLRGFRRDRFAGDAALNASAEVRIYLTRLKLTLFQYDFGVFGFGDTGRVWLDGASPGEWHTTFGGGLWIAPVKQRFTFSLGFGQSDEGIKIHAGSGFAF